MANLYYQCTEDKQQLQVCVMEGDEVVWTGKVDKVEYANDPQKSVKPNV